MSWLKSVDAGKFPKDGMVLCSWSEDAGAWLCALFSERTPEDEPVATGQGETPVEAILDMSLSLGAIRDTGVWTAG
jgi:hypothetical protein